MKRKRSVITALALMLGWTSACSYQAPYEGGSKPAVTSTPAEKRSEAFFVERDYQQTPDQSKAEKIVLSDGQKVSITEGGVYVLSGKAKEVTVEINAKSEAVQVILDGASIANKDRPCIYVKKADRAYVTTAAGTENSLSVSKAFSEDGKEKGDAVIFSNDTLILNGAGSLAISSSDKGVHSKKILGITGGSVYIKTADCGIRANEEIHIGGGDLTIEAGTDGMHSADKKDDQLGLISITDGVVRVTCEDDAIHAASYLTVDGGVLDLTAWEGFEGTVLTVNDGDITIRARDDGMNAGRKSDSLKPEITINGGTIRIATELAETDAMDANGDIIINGGIIEITGAGGGFDCDGKAVYNGGEIYINGKKVDSITVRK